MSEKKVNELSFEDINKVSGGKLEVIDNVKGYRPEHRYIYKVVDDNGNLIKNFGFDIRGAELFNASYDTGKKAATK